MAPNGENFDRLALANAGKLSGVDLPRAPEFLSGGEIPIEIATGQLEGKDAPPGYRYETRTRNVPVTRMVPQNQTRTVPAQRTRTETRTRVLPDGTEEEYQESVPYTENVTQPYTVNVPVQEMVTQNYQVLVPIDGSKTGTPLAKLESKLIKGEELTEADREMLWIAAHENRLSVPGNEGVLRQEYSIDSNISQAEIQLRTAKMRFGSTHPSVKTAKETLKRWKAYKKTREDALAATMRSRATPNAIAAVKTESQSLLKFAEQKRTELTDAIGDREPNAAEIDQLKKITQLEYTLENLNSNPLENITMDRLNILENLLARSKENLGATGSANEFWI